MLGLQVCAMLALGEHIISHRPGLGFFSCRCVECSDKGNVRKEGLGSKSKARSIVGGKSAEAWSIGHIVSEVRKKIP